LKSRRKSLLSLIPNRRSRRRDGTLLLYVAAMCGRRLVLMARNHGLRLALFDLNNAIMARHLAMALVRR
jgi:hypothetical protein